MSNPIHHNSAEEASNKSRRQFIKGAALAAASFYIFPRHVLGGPGFIAPSDKMNIAGVGVGGMGRANLLNLSTQNIVALCDVDWDFAGKAYNKLPTDMEAMQKRIVNTTTDQERNNLNNQLANLKNLNTQYAKAKQFTDYRVMFDKMGKDIDGVVIATPDHTHATIAMEAIRRKKHLYVQKPLTYTVHEARTLMQESRKAKIVTQMGNQGHSREGSRLIYEWVNDGAIGDVRTVYAWTNRPIWPQGIPRPEETMAVPAKLDWDLFVGPAPMRPYNPAYHPFKWRGWVDYGVGALGDMGAHLLDQPNWALQLGAPVSIEATSTPFGGSLKDPATYPSGTMVTYEFAARGNKPPVTLIWFDGGLMPPKPAELGPDENMNKAGGVLFVGDKGKLMHETYGDNPRLLPASRMAEYKQPAKTIPRIENENHEMDWVRCAKNGKIQPSASFDYSAPLTETMLLGMVATRVPGKKLLWDSANMKFTNAPEADKFITREYRQGFGLNA